MKVRGTLLKFGAENSVLDVISSDCEIDIPEMVPIIFDFDYTKPPIGYAVVERTDEGLIFTGEITDPKMIEMLTNTYDCKECMGCGGHYNCVKRDGLGKVVQMKLKAVSSTYAPVNPDYKFEIVEEEEEEIWCTECPYFKYVADDDDSWYGAKCHKDGHEANPSMYAVQSLHDDCPLKKVGMSEEEDVVRCATAIKEYCDSQPTCQKCRFKEENGTEHMCALHKCPNEWEVEKESEVNNEGNG